MSPFRVIGAHEIPTALWIVAPEILARIERFHIHVLAHENVKVILKHVSRNAVVDDSLPQGHDEESLNGVSR